MTIASEITRLQEAKADIKASIENKGVPVPNSAKYDDYSGYIDQISTGSGLYSGLTLQNYIWDSRDVAPTISGYYSWVENDIQYALLVGSLNTTSSSSYYKYGGVGIKHIPGNNLQYISGLIGDTYSDARHMRASGSYFLKNATDGIVRGYLIDDTSFTHNWIYVFEVVYDYRNSTCSASLYTTTESYDLPSIVTIPSGYVAVSGSEWISNVTPNRDDNNSCFYITLK